MKVSELQAAIATSVDVRAGKRCCICGKPAAAASPYSEWRGAVRPLPVCAKHWTDQYVALRDAGVDVQALYPHPTAA